MRISAYIAFGPAARRSAAAALLALVGGTTCGGLFVGRLAASGHLVSQKGRTFQPGSLTVERGDTLTIVNDDSDLLHHVYIESGDFNFDSGDQEPGSRASVTMSQRGTYQALCGIHPKMKLLIRVQ